MAEFKERRRTLALDLIDQGKSVDDSDLPDVEKPLKDLIDRIIPGVSLNGVIEENNNYRLVFENRTGKTVNFEELSSGEVDIISVLFFVAEQEIEAKINQYSESERASDGDLVVLIDGPESYLHPYLQLQFIDFLSEYVESRDSIQIILVTHSEIILNHTEAENLWYLLYPDMVTENQLKSADNIDVDLLQGILGELGSSALATGNPLLLVEGDTDREILTRLYPDIRDSMTILPIEGKQRVVQLDNAIDKLMSNLLENGIQIFSIIDNDRGPAETSSDYIFELPVTDIENVLLQPEALFEAITALSNKKAIAEEGYHDPGDMERLLNEVISRENIIEEEIRLRINDELRFEAGLSSSEEISKQTVLERYDEVVETSRERISDRFDRIKEEVESAVDANKTAEFNGKRILGEVAKEFGLQTDSLRLLTASKIEKTGSRPAYMDDIIEEIKAKIDT